MTPRQLKRLEDLLRVLNDSAATLNERRLAAEFALQMVVAVRSGKPATEWKQRPTMRRLECALCGGEIPPASNMYAVNDPPEYRHAKCHSARIESDLSTRRSK